RLGAQALTLKDLDLSLLLARQGIALDDNAATRADLVADLERSPYAMKIDRPLPGRTLGTVASPDGSMVMTWNNQSTLAVLDPVTGAVRFEAPKGYGPPQFTASNQVLTYAPPGQAATASVLDPSSGAVLRQIQWPGDNQCSIGVTPDLSELGIITSDC